MTKATRQWYPRYVADYHTATKHLTLTEHGAYAMLMDQYYLTEKPIPNNLEQVFRICHAVVPLEQQAVVSILDQFFTKKGDFFIHDRVEEELKKRRKLSKKRAESGAKGGDAARDNRAAKGVAKGVANATASADTLTLTVTGEEEKGDVPSPEKKSPHADISPDVWDDFVEMRKKLKKPVTDGVIKRLVPKLEKLRDESGHAMNDVLGQSILKGWQDVFPIKQEGSNHESNHQGEPSNSRTLLGAVAEGLQRTQ